MTKKQKKMLYRIIAALALVLVLKLLPPLPVSVELLLYCIPYLVVGWDVLRKALLGIKNRQPFDECFLMAVATVGAFALGDYVEGCAVIIFYQIGELFQGVAVGKSRRSISALMDIRPDYANIEGEDGKLEQVDPDEVEIGTIIVVQPGERVPIDGVIVEGASTLNTAALTSVTPKTGIDVDVLRVFNNNVVLARDGDREVILTGRGIGFQAKPGQHVDDAKIVRRFIPVDGKDPDHMAQQVAGIPPEIIRLVTDAMNRTGLKEQADKQPTLVMALADHICGAIQRAQRKQNRISARSGSTFPIRRRIRQRRGDGRRDEHVFGWRVAPQ